MDLGRIRRQIGLLAVAEPELPFHPRLYHPDAVDRYVQNGIRSEVLDDAYGAGPVPRVVRGANVLGAHTNRFRAALALERLISPFGDQDNRLKELRDIMERRNLQAHVTFFWRGPPGVQHPTIPSVATATLRRLPADIEPDIETADC